MAGTSAVAAKRAIITALAAFAVDGGSLDGDGDNPPVQVCYSFPGVLLRECVYGGSIIGPVELSAMRGSGRVKRLERPVLQLHVLVTEPGHDTTEATDLRAAAIGAVIEDYLAANPTLGGTIAELKAAVVVGMELDGGVDDESAESVLTYQIQLLSQLA